ncbi:MAG TPA: GTP-binding protein, partial [Thermoleophilia bacterium]|nr:GTP-binding protein [Thermoleophilia bacterium]
MHAAQTIRNLAIIAHIDHGKTTLIDSIFRAARVFRDNARVEERVMDSGDLERERGITIRSKHCTVEWGGYLINIIDTPGHADFSGEVERVLSMVDSVLLLVDANEGPMPQTRYVLMRALRLGLRPIVVVNKVDRPNADPSGALDRTFDLFVELGASNRQLDFPVLYGSGLEGWIVEDIHEYMKEEHEREERLVDGGGLSPMLLKELADAGMSDLFETIVREVPAPAVDQTAPFRMQVSTLAWSDYIGRIGCGRVLEGQLKVGDELRRVTTARLKPEEPEAGWRVTGTEAARVTHLWVTRGLDNRAVDEVAAGDIVWLAGPEDITL